jgi:hypothetical protein
MELVNANQQILQCWSRMYFEFIVYLVEQMFVDIVQCITTSVPGDFHLGGAHLADVVAAISIASLNDGFVQGYVVAGALFRLATGAGCACQHP